MTEQTLPNAVSERISDVRPLVLQGEVDAAMELSGVALAGDFLALGADEGHQLQILRRQNGTAWALAQRVALAKQDQEADIEAITFGDGHLYVVGSHSLRRRRLKPELSVRRNRERLLQVEEQDARCRLYRIPFDTGTGDLGPVQRIDLRKRLRKDPLLGPFSKLPGKENGVDIEGVAFSRGLLHLGFRGPVLRDNYVPVMSLRFDRPKDYALRYVRLDGQGIRDICALDEGFLILSGPVNDAAGPFCLWWWDGSDQIPGKGRTPSPARRLAEISTPGGAKAEGLAVVDSGPGDVDLIVIYETGTAAQAVAMRLRLGE